MSSPEPVHKRSSLPVVAGVLVVGLLLLGGGLALRNLFPAPEPEQAEVEEGVAVESEAPGPGDEAPTAPESTTASAEVAGLKASIADLSSRLDRVQAQAQQQPKAAANPDLKPLQDRLDEVARSTEGLADLPGRFEEMGARLDGFEKTHAELRDEIATIREQAKGAPAQPAPAEATATPAVDEADTALAEGIELFKQNQYAKALEQFRKATEATPDDARAWYYAALASGLSTNQWRGGETERLVNQGVQHEKEGEPARAKIDEAFAGLTTAQGKDWLVYYRKQAAGR